MSTTTWSAAKAFPRASLAALPNCSTNQAWNFETPIVVLCSGALREALRISYARRRRVAASQKVRIYELSAHALSHSSKGAFPLRRWRVCARRSTIRINSSDG
mmetsp:Transcript_8712/g.23646  ORF Transcript_8712/g.23646 Transcript_8712/m.23646 type:complete len:103 (-) Transcript_8712:32-340(-)